MRREAVGLAKSPSHSLISLLNEIRRYLRGKVLLRGL